MADRFRKRYVTLSASNTEIVERIKDYAGFLAVDFESAQSRELSLALTKLEEAVFWATKHFTAPERQG